MGANAQTSVPAFTSGQVLTAAQVTQINTGMPVFASSTERDAAFGGTGEKTLAEGQMAYLEDTNATQYYDGSSWAAVAGGKILQVVRATDTTNRTTTSTSFVDANISVTITPTSATSTILVMWLYQALNAAGSDAFIGQITDSSNVALSGAESLYVGSVTVRVLTSVTAIGYSSPATTSATTYKARFRSESGGTQNLRNALQTGQLFAFEVAP